MTRRMRIPAVAAATLAVALAACFPVKPDLQGPPPPSIDEYASPTSAGELTLSGSKEPDTSLTLNGVEVIPNDGATTWSLGPMPLAIGTNHFVLRTHDQYGNGSEPAIASALRDPFPPGTVRTIAPLDGGATRDPRPLLRWVPALDQPLPGAPEGGGLVRYRVEISSTASFATQGSSFDVTAQAAGDPPAVTPPADLPPGWNFWRVTATDSAGNIGTPSHVRQFFHGVQGDADGDGAPDIVAGAPFAGTDDRGRARVLKGGASLATLFDLSGAAAGDAFGTVVKMVPDASGDLRAETLIAAPDAGNGVVTVRFGGSENALAISGPAGWLTGTAIAGGDLDRDGLAEIAIGSPATGTVYVFRGGTLTTAGTIDTAAEAHMTLEGAGGTGFGQALAMAGDTNGDGLLEIAVGAPSAEGGAGRVYVFDVPAVLVSGTALLVANARELSQTGTSAFGSALDGGRDVDDDGLPDIVVGSPGNGRAYLHYGAGEPASVVLPAGGAAAFGSAVALIGPFDGSTAPRSAIVVGNPAGAGALSLFTVDATRFAAQVATAAGTAGTSEGLGATVAPAGDLDGDGHADFLAGAPLRDPTPGLPTTTTTGTYGRVYVYRGSTIPVLTVSTSFQLVPTDSENNLDTTAHKAPESGRSVSGIAP